MGTGKRYSLEEIADYIEGSLTKFVEENRPELVRAVREQDYEDVPQLPIYEFFYFNKLVPQVRDMMTQSGYNEEEIKKMVGFGDELFYREILPGMSHKNGNHCSDDRHATNHNPL